MSTPFRVLQINSGSANFGGVSSFLYNIYTHIDKEQVQFDFLSPDKTTYEIKHKEITDMGGNIYEFRIKGNIFYRKLKLYSRLKSFLKENKYKIVHINSGNFFFNLFASAAVKKAGVPVRIIHSHNAGDTCGKLKRLMFGILKPVMEKNATNFLACSELAAEYMFTKKTVESGRVIVIPNGIDASKFSYNENVRIEMRKKLGLEDKFILGNVARFMPQKNHKFLIEVFERLAQVQENAILLLVGQGELMNEIKALVHEKELDSKVIFLGQRNDVDKLYQAMDVFVLTSFHEGFPVTGVEVQSCGLPFILSDTITKEIKLTDCISFLSLNDSTDKWANAILQYRSVKRQDCSEIIEKKGYSQQFAANKLKEFYFECVKK